ncbi:hypothetical protein ZWY2020_034792 [Hordeum vulgare]|nr:hypothetical protein ZWY2020_034792 [Hordeum vulgare]
MVETSNWLAAAAASRCEDRARGEETTIAALAPLALAPPTTSSALVAPAASPAPSRSPEARRLLLDDSRGRAVPSSSGHSITGSGGHRGEAVVE